MPLIEADRAARAQGYGGFSSYEHELMRREGPMIAGQISRAAALLASIWLHEWERASRPAVCQTLPRIRRLRHPRVLSRRISLAAASRP